MGEHAEVVVMLGPGEKAPRVESVRVGDDEMAGIDFVWPCAYVGPATENGSDDGCEAEASEDGLFCDEHEIRSGQVEGCTFCWEIGASDEHQEECAVLFLHCHGHPEGREADCPHCNVDDDGTASVIHGVCGQRHWMGTPCPHPDVDNRGSSS